MNFSPFHFVYNNRTLVAANLYLKQMISTNSFMLTFIWSISYIFSGRPHVSVGHVAAWAQQPRAHPTASSAPSATRLTPPVCGNSRKWTPTTWRRRSRAALPTSRTARCSARRTTGRKAISKGKIIVFGFVPSPASRKQEIDRQRARVYIPNSYGIYTLWYFCGVKQILFCNCSFLLCHYSDSTEIWIIFFSIAEVQLTLSKVTSNSSDRPIWFVDDPLWFADAAFCIQNAIKLAISWPYWWKFLNYSLKSEHVWRIILNFAVN